jgi:hypothetical protein
VGGLDPDNHSIEGDRLIGERRWEVWQKPAGDEQQNRKRASDEDKIAGYRQCLSFLKIEQFRFAFRNTGKAECITGQASARLAKARQ